MYIVLENIDVSNLILIKIIAVGCFLYLCFKGMENCIDRVCDYPKDFKKNLH